MKKSKKYREERCFEKKESNIYFSVIGDHSVSSFKCQDHSSEKEKGGDLPFGLLCHTE